MPVAIEYRVSHLEHTAINNVGRQVGRRASNFHNPTASEPGTPSMTEKLDLEPSGYFTSIRGNFFVNCVTQFAKLNRSTDSRMHTITLDETWRGSADSATEVKWSPAERAEPADKAEPGQLDG